MKILIPLTIGAYQFDRHSVQVHPLSTGVFNPGPKESNSLMHLMTFFNDKLYIVILLYFTPCQDLNS
jgi:hypothetical protein